MKKAVIPDRIDAIIADRSDEPISCLVYGDHLDRLFRTGTPISTEEWPDEFPPLLKKTRNDLYALPSVCHSGDKEDKFFHPDAHSVTEAALLNHLRSERNPRGYGAPWIIPEDERDEWMVLLNGNISKMLELVASGVSTQDYLDISKAYPKLSKVDHFRNIVLGLAIVDELYSRATETSGLRRYTGEERIKLMYRATSLRDRKSGVDYQKDTHIGSILVAAILSDLCEIVTGEDRFSENSRTLFWMASDHTVRAYGIAMTKYNPISRINVLAKKFIELKVWNEQSSKSQSNPPSVDLYHLVVRAEKMIQHSEKHGLSKKSLGLLVQYFISRQSKKGEERSYLGSSALINRAREDQDITPETLDLLTDDDSVRSFCELLEYIEMEQKVKWSDPIYDAVGQVLSGVPKEWVKEMYTVPQS